MALAARHTRRVRARPEQGYPCRISLTDAPPDSTVLLTNYVHHPVDSPYRGSFAVYVREGEVRYDACDEVPAQLRTRLLALRAYDCDAMLIGCEIAHGSSSRLPSLDSSRTRRRSTCSCTSPSRAATPRARERGLPA